MRYTTSMDQEMKRRVTACAAGFSLPRYRELPAVGLYTLIVTAYRFVCSKMPVLYEHPDFKDAH